MTLFHKIIAIAGLSSAALIPGLAHADDAPPAVQAFLDNLERQMAAKPSFDSLKVDGDKVTITNLSVAKPAKDNDPAVTLKTATVDFSGLSDKGNSLWQIGKANFTNSSLELTSKDGTLSASIPNATVDGWYVRTTPAAPGAKDELLSTMTFANKMDSGPISFTTAGQTIKIDNIETNWDGDPTTGTGKFSLKVNNVAIPEATLDLFDTDKIWKQLGYSGLNFDIATTGDVLPSGNDLAYSFKLSMGARDVATITLAAAVDKLPVAVYAQMLKDQLAGKGLDFAAMSPQLQNVEITGASLRFDDASFTKKLLPLVAKMQGMDEQVLVASIPPTVQLTLLQLQNAELTKQGVDAVTQFLADPKSLMLSIKPTAPITVGEFNKLDPAKPGDAVTRLGVTMTANQ